MKLPIAEVFTAPQGEGIYTGTLMLFIRTAGCSVGRPWTKEGLAKEKTRTECLEDKGYQVSAGPIFQILPHHEMCTLFDGRTFCCDTDYSKHLMLPLSDVAGMVELAKVRHVCITGGEPLLHSEVLKYLFKVKFPYFVQFHLETSGTVSLDDQEVQNAISNLKINGGHITISPKLGYLDEEYSSLADEAKLLVDEDFSIDKVPPKLKEQGERGQLKVYLQPINGIDELSKENMDRCLRIQLKYPWMRLSSQAHKLWGTQ